MSHQRKQCTIIFTKISERKRLNHAIVLEANAIILREEKQFRASEKKMKKYSKLNEVQ